MRQDPLDCSHPANAADWASSRPEREVTDLGLSLHCLAGKAMLKKGRETWEYFFNLNSQKEKR